MNSKSQLRKDGFAGPYPPACQREHRQRGNDGLTFHFDDVQTGIELLSLYTDEQNWLLRVGCFERPSKSPPRCWSPLPVTGSQAVNVQARIPNRLHQADTPMDPTFGDMWHRSLTSRRSY